MASFPCRQRCVTTAKPDACRAGNGLLSAAASGLSALFRQPFMIKDYHEHTRAQRQPVGGLYPLRFSARRKLLGRGYR